MLDKKGFDLWADGYDDAVGLSDEQNSFPFAGYKSVLGTIYRIILQKPQASVLDIGFGTATLTTKLYEKGCRIFGQDFSERMAEIASQKMPRANLYVGDFSKGLCNPLLKNTYDYIVATYSLHHLTDSQKIPLLQILHSLLNDKGKILIGDVSFSTLADMEYCQKEAEDLWDTEEYYIVADNLRPYFPSLSFERISFCAGILTIPR